MTPRPGREQVSFPLLLLGCVVSGILVMIFEFWLSSFIILPQGAWQSLWSYWFPDLTVSCFTRDCDRDWLGMALLYVFPGSVLVGIIGGFLSGFPIRDYMQQALDRRQATVQVRGSRLGSAAEVNKTTSEVASLTAVAPIQIGGVSFPSHLETLSLLTCGSPGTGKTTNINQMLRTIRQRKDNKTIIYDANGDYLKAHYRPGDIVLGFSPWTTHTWSPWSEYPDRFGFENVAQVLVPETGKDTFWSDAARTILTTLMEVSSSWAELQRLVYYGEIKELVKLTRGKEAHRLLTSKEAMSILTGMASRLSFFRYLKDPTSENELQPFNFQQWATDSDTNAWVFLVVPDQWKNVAKPIITVYFDVICGATFQRAVEPLSTSRLWLVIDELASLGYLPRLEDFLSQGRKYGGSAILGFQLISQLIKIYEQQGANSILGCCQSKLILRTADGETCKFIAELIGQREYYESKRTVTKETGLEGKRSTSESYEKRTDYLVMPSEISTLPRFHGILVMPELPVSRIVTDPKIGREVVIVLPEARPVTFNFPLDDRYSQAALPPEQDPDINDEKEADNLHSNEQESGRVRERDYTMPDIGMDY